MYVPTDNALQLYGVRAPAQSKVERADGSQIYVVAAESADEAQLCESYIDLLSLESVIPRPFSTPAGTLPPSARPPHAQTWPTHARRTPPSAPLTPPPPPPFSHSTYGADIRPLPRTNAPSYPSQTAPGTFHSVMTAGSNPRARVFAEAYRRAYAQGFVAEPHQSQSRAYRTHPVDLDTPALTDDSDGDTDEDYEDEDLGTGYVPTESRIGGARRSSASQGQRRPP